MTKRRAWLRFFLGEIQVFGLLHSVLAVVLCALAPGLVPWSLLLFIPALGMGLARALLPNALLLVLSHGALAAWPVLLPLGDIPRLIAVVFLALLALASLYKRLAAERTERENRENHGGDDLERYERIRGDGAAYRFSFGVVLLMGLFNVALTLLAGYFGVRGADPWLLGWALVLLACGLAARQTGAVDGELAHLAKRTRQPVRQILRMDNALLVILLALVLVALVLAVTLPLDKLLAAIGAALYAALVALLRFIASLFTGGQPEEPVEEPVAQPLAPVVEAEPPGEPFWLFELLSTLLAIVVGLAATALVLYGLYQLYKRFSGARGVSEGDEREFILPGFEAARLEGVLARLRARLPDFGGGERARVRRRYYRAVRRHIRRGAKITGTQTAGEIERALEEREDLHALTAQYNRARYSGPD